MKNVKNAKNYASQTYIAAASCIKLQTPHVSCTEIWNFSTWEIFSPRAWPVGPWQIWCMPCWCLSLFLVISIAWAILLILVRFITITPLIWSSMLKWQRLGCNWILRQRSPARSWSLPSLEVCLHHHLHRDRNDHHHNWDHDDHKDIWRDWQSSSKLEHVTVSKEGLVQANHLHSYPHASWFFMALINIFALVISQFSYIRVKILSGGRGVRLCRWEVSIGFISRRTRWQFWHWLRFWMIEGGGWKMRTFSSPSLDRGVSKSKDSTR